MGSGISMIVINKCCHIGHIARHVKLQPFYLLHYHNSLGTCKEDKPIKAESHMYNLHNQLN